MKQNQLCFVELRIVILLLIKLKTDFMIPKTFFLKDMIFTLYFFYFHILLFLLQQVTTLGDWAKLLFPQCVGI